MFNFTFEYPFVLLSIIPFILCSFFCKAKSPTYYIPHLDILKESKTTTHFILPVLKWIVIFFSIIALASPIKILNTKLIQNDGIDIVLSLDTSGSMRAIGFNKDNLEQNRWQVVSQLVKEFIKKRVNDNIGIVVFGNSVLTASPISFDKNAQQEIINYLDIGIVGDKTAMVDSLATSINILKDSKSKSKIIILLTDGIDTYSTIPLSVVNKLSLKHNIKIYAIGIGESNRIFLNKIVSQTKGKMFIANSKNDLKNIYDEINRLETSKIDTNKIILKDYFFFYPLFLAIFSLILYVFLKNKE